MKRQGWIMAIAIASATVSPAVATEPWEERTPEIGRAGRAVSGRLDAARLKALTDLGEKLFSARFTILDGAGRPEATQAIVPTKRKHPPAIGEFSRTAGMDANACSSCHNLPAVGGAGDFTANVFVSEGFESADFDSIDPQFSNERGSNHLFGAGLLELLAREITEDLKAQRETALKKAAASGEPQRIALSSKGIDYGYLTVAADGMVDMKELDGIDMDLVVRPFSQKGVMTSLRQFTVNALNHHHGMEPVERFGGRWTGSPDFDGDRMNDEMNDGDVSAIVAWQATLPVPTIKVPGDPAWRDAAAQGRTLFAGMGCTECHKPALPLESLAFADPGPFDVAGTLNDRQVKDVAIYDIGLRDWASKLPRDDKGRVMVSLLGDLKRHTMTDKTIETLGNELMAQRFVDRNIFMTAELWGVGSTPPYGHRNDMTTMDEIIRAHGGDGRRARDAYVAASDRERSAIIAYLKTLVIEP